MCITRFVIACFILQQAFKNTEKGDRNFLKQRVDLKKTQNPIKQKNPKKPSMKCQCSLFVVKLITSSQFTCIIIWTILICEL